MTNKLAVRVCVGSSCHVKGGTKTLKALEALIEGAHLADRVELRADLCLDNCLEAPNVVVEGCVHGGVTPDRAEAFFNEHILAQVKQCQAK